MIMNIVRRPGVSLVKRNTVASMRDLIRDWRRWTKAERVLAGVIVVLLVVGLPTLLAIDGRLSPG
jgi:hypothetical protein